MNYLAIDTSGKWLTVIANGKNKHIEFIEDCALTHSVMLLGKVEEALLKAGITLSEVEVFACALGPGSFTGIRIGVSTVKAFVFSLGKKAVGVTSFDTLAYYRVNENKKLVLINAGHNNYYACYYDKDNKPFGKPFFASADEIRGLKDFDEIICDEECPFENFYKAEVVAGFERAVESKLNEATNNEEVLVPLYVKKSQAEEEAR